MLFPHLFSNSPKNPLLLCLPSTFIVFLQWDTNHYGFTNSHAFPLSSESQGIIIPSEDYLETCSRCQIAFGSGFPKGTNNSRLLTIAWSILCQSFTISSIGVRPSAIGFPPNDNFFVPIHVFWAKLSPIEIEVHFPLMGWPWLLRPILGLR